MRVCLVVLMLAPALARAQPADCAVQPMTGPTLPLALDLGGRPGVPSGTTGQASIDLPLGVPGYACGLSAPPSDILRGDPGDVLHGPPSGDLLRGSREPSGKTR